MSAASSSSVSSAIQSSAYQARIDKNSAISIFSNLDWWERRCLLNTCHIWKKCLEESVLNEMRQIQLFDYPTFQRCAKWLAKSRAEIPRWLTAGKPSEETFINKHLFPVYPSEEALALRVRELAHEVFERCPQLRTVDLESMYDSQGLIHPGVLSESHQFHTQVTSLNFGVIETHMNALPGNLYPQLTELSFMIRFFGNDSEEKLRQASNLVSRFPQLNRLHGSFQPPSNLSEDAVALIHRYLPGLTSFQCNTKTLPIGSLAKLGEKYPLLKRLDIITGSREPFSAVFENAFRELTDLRFTTSGREITKEEFQAISTHCRKLERVHIPERIAADNALEFCCNLPELTSFRSYLKCSRKEAIQLIQAAPKLNELSFNQTKAGAGLPAREIYTHWGPEQIEKIRKALPRAEPAPIPQEKILGLDEEDSTLEESGTSKKTEAK